MNQCYALVAVLLTCELVICSLPKVRHVTVERAPGCKKWLTCEINIFHVEAVGPNDTLHYLWDFTRTPSLLIALTENNATLRIDYGLFFNNSQDSVTITPPPFYSFMVVINELLEFDDVEDTGYISITSKNVSYDLGDFNWKLGQNNMSSVELEFIGSQNRVRSPTLALNGSVSVKLLTFGEESHYSVLPRLLHSENSSQAAIILQGLQSNSNFNNSRWAIGLEIIASNFCNKTLFVNMRKSLDDEYAPGVFRVYDIVNPVCPNMGDESGYIHWRPVTYTSHPPNLSNSSDVAILEPSSVKDPLLRLHDNLAAKFYGSLLKEMLVEHTLVTFGSPQDGFYKKTNFTSWTFLVAYGTPPEDDFSMIPLLVMGIGLGIPAVLSLIGGAVLCARRFIGRQRDLEP